MEALIKKLDNLKEDFKGKIGNLVVNLENKFKELKAKPENSKKTIKIWPEITDTMLNIAMGESTDTKNLEQSIVNKCADALAELKLKILMILNGENWMKKTLLVSML